MNDDTDVASLSLKCCIRACFKDAPSHRIQHLQYLLFETNCLLNHHFCYELLKCNGLFGRGKIVLPQGRKYFSTKILSKLSKISSDNFKNVFKLYRWMKKVLFKLCISLDKKEFLHLQVFPCQAYLFSITQSASSLSISHQIPMWS